MILNMYQLLFFIYLRGVMGVKFDFIFSTFPVENSCFSFQSNDTVEWEGNLYACAVQAWFDSYWRSEIQGEHDLIWVCDSIVEGKPIQFKSLKFNFYKCHRL